MDPGSFHLLSAGLTARTAPSRLVFFTLREPSRLMAWSPSSSPTAPTDPHWIVQLRFPSTTQTQRFQSNQFPFHSGLPPPPGNQLRAPLLSSSPCIREATSSEGCVFLAALGFTPPSAPRPHSSHPMAASGCLAGAPWLLSLSPLSSVQGPPHTGS